MSHSTKHNYYQLCKYCGDKFTKNLYCSGYCEYRDTVIVPRKLKIINKIHEKVKFETKLQKEKFQICLKQLKSYTFK